MPAPENAHLVTMRLDTAQLERLAHKLRDPNRSRIVRKALDRLEGELSGAPASDTSEAFILSPKRSRIEGRAPFTVRLDESLMSSLKHSLNLNATQLITRAVEELYDREVYAKLPPLIQDEH
jgi:hypothetical protein